MGQYFSKEKTRITNKRKCSISLIIRRKCKSKCCEHISCRWDETLSKTTAAVCGDVEGNPHPWQWVALCSVGSWKQAKPYDSNPTLLKFEKQNWKRHVCLNVHATVAPISRWMNGFVALPLHNEYYWVKESRLNRVLWGWMKLEPNSEVSQKKYNILRIWI